MRILIADDEEIERTALRDILKSEPDIETVEVSNGQEVLNYLMEGPKVDLCLIDILMPEVDGVQVLQRIRRDHALRDHRVVITSASRDRTLVVTLAQLGISGYLLKPYDATRVKAVIQQIASQIPRPAAKTPEARVEVVPRSMLIVDDDPEIRRQVHELVVLEPGWSCIEADNGAKAFAALKEGLKPSLCVCDTDMPEMDGLSFLQKVRGDPDLKSLPIMMISTEHTAQGVRQYAELGVSAYLLKPLNAEKIRSIIHHLAQGGVYGHMQVPPH